MEHTEREEKDIIKDLNKKGLYTNSRENVLCNDAYKEKLEKKRKLIHRCRKEKGHDTLRKSLVVPSRQISTQGKLFVF